MDIGVMRMGVRQRLVTMGMRVRLHAIPDEVMRMLVVLVVPVTVRMLQRLVRVFMRMPLPDVEPDAQCHEQCRSPEEG